MATEEKQDKRAVEFAPMDVGDVDVSLGVPLGMRETYPYAALYIGQSLREHKVDIAFGVQGGHIWDMVDSMSNHGVKLITFGHEQNGVYAAEAYSKVTNRPGVVFATAGPGMTNCISPTQQAYLSGSPLVLLMGGVAPEQDGAYSIQIAYAEEMMAPCTKWSKRLQFPSMYKHWMAKAFKDCQDYPKRPVCLEFAIGGLRYTPIPPLPGNHSLYKDNWRGDKTGEPVLRGGDPELIERAVRMLYESKHPLIFAADGVHWSGGAAELVELAELARVPVSTRRVTRGAIPENHPLWMSNRIVNRVIKDCDLAIPIGMKVSAFDNNYGKTWPKAIQINESHEHIWTFLNTEIAILGSAKVVLRQMIDCIKANGLTPPPERDEWCRRIYEGQLVRNKELDARAEKYSKNAPVHWGYLSKVVRDTMEDLYGGMNRVVMDGFSISGYFPPFLNCRYGAQYIDSSEQAGVGHGIAMAIGAAFGDLPGAYKAPVVAMMGDAGMHNAGMDIETAIRFQLPIVYVVTNNGGWLTGMKHIWYGQNWDAMGEQDRGLGQEFVQNLRYDQMFAIMGAHGEYVERPEQIRPAMERAFRAAQEGKPAVVNCMMDQTVANPVVNDAYYTGFGHIPWEKLPKRGKAIRRNTMKWFPWDKVGVPPMSMPNAWDPIPKEELEP